MSQCPSYWCKAEYWSLTGNIWRHIWEHSWCHYLPQFCVPIAPVFHPTEWVDTQAAQASVSRLCVHQWLFVLHTPEAGQLWLVWNTAAAQLGCADLCTGHPEHAAALSAPSGLPGMPAWCQMLLLLWTAWYLEIPNKWTSSLVLLESV